MDDRQSKTHGPQWQRVPTLPPLDQNAVKRFHAREQTLKNPVFIEACNRAKVDPTPRQACKWNMGKGAARNAR